MRHPLPISFILHRRTPMRSIRGPLLDKINQFN